MKAMILAVVGCMSAGAAAAATQYVFPTKGQDKVQQAQDEAACTAWASEQTGFDPTKKPKASTSKNAHAAAKALSSPEATAAISALAGKNASSINSVTGALGGFGGANSTASSWIDQAAAYQPPQSGQKSGDADFSRARAVCLSAKGYSVG